MTQEELTTSEFLEAFQKLQEGEKTATQLEKMLDELEGKIEEVLKEAESITKEEEEQEQPVK